MPRRYRSKPPEESHHGRPVDRRIIVGVCVFLVAIIWFVFAQTLGHKFVNYDDKVYVENRPEINRGFSIGGVTWALTHSHGGNWHPLTSISHMLDCQFFGLNAGAHHFTSVLLHTIAVLLLFFLLRQMTGALWCSAFVAALFAIHPLHVESVAWVAERKDVLSGVFFMLTLGAYVRYVRNPSLARYLAMSILFALGLMSKPMLVTIPFVLLLIDYWPLQRQPSLEKTFVEKIPLFLLAAGSCVATILAQTNAITSLENSVLSWRIENAFASIIIYIGQMFLPLKLAVFYPHPHDQLPVWMAALSIELVVALSVAAVVVGRRFKYIPVGWFWYLGMLVPVLGIVQVGIHGHADRYTYLPQIGLYMLITWGIVDLAARWRYGRQILGAAAVIVVGALIWLARIQTGFWQDTETLWRHALSVTTGNQLAHASLGEIALSRNQLEQAMAHYNAVLEVSPDNEDAHNQLGIALMRAGDPSAAIAHWITALEIEPDDMNAKSNLAWVFATCPNPLMRDGRRAVELMEDVIRRSGTRNAILLRTLAAAYAESVRFPDAIKTAEEALELAIAQGNSGLADNLRSNIDNYQMNRPFRDSSLANAHPSP